MNINPKYLKDVVTAEIILEILRSEPQDRLSIMNKYLSPLTDLEWTCTYMDFANAAAEAIEFMRNKPKIEWLDENERGFDLLERVTGYRP